MGENAAYVLDEEQRPATAERQLTADEARRLTLYAQGFLGGGRRGGVAMVPRPTWWAFWLGVGIAVVGCLMTLFAKTFTDDWY